MGDTSAVSKLDYLKRYLSDEKDVVKKRKKKRPFNPKATAGIIVIDSGLLADNIHAGKFEDDPYRNNEPTIVEIVDDSIPRGMQDSAKWKPIIKSSVKDAPEDEDGAGPVVIRTESPDSSSLQLACSSRPKVVKTSPRTQRGSPDSDLSPKRKQDSARRNPRNHPSSDMSPLRRGQRRSRSLDISPVRRSKFQKTESDQRRRRRSGSEDSDMSPVRRPTVEKYGESPRKTTLSGLKAGLQTAQTLKEETERRRRHEEEMFRKMDTEISGRNAATVYRDKKTGKRRNLEEEAVEEAEKAARKRIHEEKFRKWGRGLAQQEKQEQSVQDAVHELTKPLARYADDADRDDLLKARDRIGDPMLEYLSKKKKKNRDTGKERPRYNGPPPAPNRFGILPGYRWDGVDRSCGFEKERFNRLSNRVATTEQAYKWSTEDM